MDKERLMVDTRVVESVLATMGSCEVYYGLAVGSED